MSDKHRDEKRPGAEQFPSFTYLAVSTDGQAPCHAYDYWCETVFTGWDANRADGAQRRGFDAWGAGLGGSRGDAYWYRSDAIAGRRTLAQCRRGEGDQAILGLVISGRRHHEQQEDRMLSAGPGELIYYDPTQPSRTAWEPHRGVHLSLDSGSVHGTLGGRAPLPSLLLAALRQSPLYPFLHAQLLALARHGEQLAEHERALVVEQTIDLALGALDNCPLGGTTLVGGGRGLFAAAQRLIRQQMHDPKLNAGTLAARLGCSRATLYRAFSERDLTVAGYLREMRLQQVRRLLQSAPRHRTIADIAAACGFMDSASFSRLFRLQYGISPRELRRHSR